MAGKNVGGRVSITLNGVVYNPVAEVEYEGSNIEVESVSNQDGSVGRSVKTKPFKAKIKYRDMAGIDMNELMAGFFDLTMIEIDTKRTVIMTDAFHEGTPSRNTVNGEIDGLTVVAEKCQVIQRA